MTKEELDEILEATLEDQTLSRGEKKTLRQRIEDAGMNPQQLGVYRSAAFDAARRALEKGNGEEILNWLEDVIRVMTYQPGDLTRRPEAWFSPEDDCPTRIAELLAECQNKADICVFTITDNRITEAIKRVFERGVRIRIVSDNDKSNDHGSDIDYLASIGVPVRLDRSDYHMHHKFVLFDDRSLLTGSYNWTRTAASSNEENFVVTYDDKLVESFQKLFDGLWDRLGT